MIVNRDTLLEIRELPRESRKFDKHLGDRQHSKNQNPGQIKDLEKEGPVLGASL
jgi:hypothetical protein